MDILIIIGLLAVVGIVVFLKRKSDKKTIVNLSTPSVSCPPSGAFIINKKL